MMRSAYLFAFALMSAVSLGLEASPAAGGNSALGPDVVGSRMSTYVGNPINVATGNKYQAESDLSISSLLEFTRHYNSQQPLSGAIGPYWTHSYSSRATTGTLGDGTQFVDMLRPTGRQLRYRLVSGAWVGDPNIAQTVVALTDANGTQTGWEWRDLSAKSFEQFDMTGRLVKIVQQDGRFATVSYNTAGQLERVQQDDGRALTFNHDDAGRIGRVVAPDGQETIFDYDSSTRLSGVLYPGGATKTYIYNESAHTAGTNQPNSLTGIVHDGVRFASYSYDTQGRAVSTEHAGGVNKFTVLRNADGSATVTTPTGSKEQRQFVTHFDTPTAQSVTRSCTDNCAAPSTAYQYDANGFVKQTVEAGVTTNRTNDAQGRATHRVEAVGTPQQRTIQTDWSPAFGVPTERRTYNTAGTLVQMVTWTLNSRGQVRISTITDPVLAISRTATNTYCEQGDVDIGTCPRVGLLTKVDGARTDLEALGDVTTFAYRMADASGCDTAPATCAYRKGDLWKATNAKQQSTETLSYDGAGRPLSVKDANGVVTDMEYTARGWLKATKLRGANATSEADDAITRMDYWPTGLVKRVTQADDSYTAFEYDAAHRLTGISNNAGERIDYVLDAAGNREREDTTDAQGNLKRTLSRVYNQLGQLQVAKDAFSHATSMTFDAQGNTDTVTDAKSRVTDNDYDPLGRLKQTLQDTAGINAKTSFGYDALDNLRTVADPKNLTTSYTYNGLGDLTKLVSPDTGTTDYTYDSAGNLKTKQDARGASFKATYAYDVLNRVTGISYATTTPNLNVTYSYDAVNIVCVAGETFALGRMTRMVDGSGNTQYCYDRFGRMVRKVQTTNGKEFATAYQYAVNGHLLVMTYPSGLRVNYDYNAAGQPRSVKVTRPGQLPETLVSDVRYLPFGPVSQLTYGEGVPRVLTRQHDKNYRPMVVQDDSGIGLKDLLGWDEVGNLMSLADSSTTPLSTPLATYKYDSLGRLKGRYAPEDSTQSSPLQAYTYDPTGNRTSFGEMRPGPGSQPGPDGPPVLATSPYTYNPDTHRLMAVGGLSRGYDEAGNLTRLGSATDPGGVTRSFFYGAHNRMSWTSGANGSMNYAYNGKGEQVRRYATGTSTQQTYQLYDEAGRWIGEYDVAGTAKQEFIWLADLPVGMVASPQNGADIYDPGPEPDPGPGDPMPPDSTSSMGATQEMESPVPRLYFIEADHLGTPRVVIDPQRNKAIWRWDLTGEAFGSSPPNEDADGDGTAFVFDMRFPGQRFDAASGLNYNYFRDYEAATGRYVESDPIGQNGGVSTYSYANAVPLQKVDPRGLISFGPTCTQSQRLAISSEIVQLAKEIEDKANKRCKDDRCNMSYAAEALRTLMATMFSCDYGDRCAVATKPNIVYLYPQVIGAPDSAEISSPKQCGCFRSLLFHEALHYVIGGIKFDERIRRETQKCVSCGSSW